MVGVGRTGGTGEFGVDGGYPGDGPILVLQEQRGGPFGHDETIAASIERA